jgi:hypothetical protein
MKEVNLAQEVVDARGTWHVARTGDGRGVYKVLVGRPERMATWNNLGVDGRIILQWIFKKKDGDAWIELFRIRRGNGDGRLWMR